MTGILTAKATNASLVPDGTARACAQTHHVPTGPGVGDVVLQTRNSHGVGSGVKSWHS